MGTDGNCPSSSKNEKTYKDEEEQKSEVLAAQAATSISANEPTRRKRKKNGTSMNLFPPTYPKVLHLKVRVAMIIAGPGRSLAGPPTWGRNNTLTYGRYGTSQHEYT